MTTLRTDTN